MGFVLNPILCGLVKVHIHAGPAQGGVCVILPAGTVSTSCRYNSVMALVHTSHSVVLLLDHLLSLLPVCLVPHGGVLEIGHGMALLCHMPVVCVLSTCSIIHITLSCLVLGLAHQLHTLALPGRM